MAVEITEAIIVILGVIVTLNFGIAVGREYGTLETFALAVLDKLSDKLRL